MPRQFDLPGRSPVYAPNAAVSTSHPLATATALQVLRDGGNAVDAAIAASATLCVVEPHMTGIGGDCFAIICEADGTTHALNGSGRAGSKATLDHFAGRTAAGISDTSGEAITVPGAVRAWETLHRKLGSMDWARLFAEAVDYAVSGFPVAPRVARDWQTQTEKLNNDEGARLHLLFDGMPPQAGRRIVFPALAATLERIAREGASAVYTGEIAAEISQTILSKGGFVTESDLASCSADWLDPISTPFMGHEILEIPPNGQGITALIMLNLLTSNGSKAEAGSAAHYHELIEFGRIAYAMRDCHVSDLEHLQSRVEDMLSDATTTALLGQYDPDRRNDQLQLPDLPDADTIYLSVVDQQGMAVSFINSVYGIFGTGIVTPKSAIALQNRGSCFSLEAGHPNVIAPGKRPLHTIIPAMAVRDGRVSICFGVMGGAYQPMGHAHVLVNMLKYGMDPQQALDFPRLFWDGDGRLQAESGISHAVVEKLRKMGHQVDRGGLHGGGQIIFIDRESNMLVAGSDPRKDGHAAGY